MSTMQHVALHVCHKAQLNTTATASGIEESSMILETYRKLALKDLVHFSSTYLPEILKLLKIKNGSNAQQQQQQQQQLIIEIGLNFQSIYFKQQKRNFFFKTYIVLYMHMRLVESLCHVRFWRSTVCYREQKTTAVTIDEGQIILKY
uniref:Uncharacterized protein n=1 Tax=Glossina palpalis gambiensis TaxID=67801 RepID=A0A1B0ALZ8_9MUSC